MHHSPISLAALLLISGTRALATMKTNFNDTTNAGLLSVNDGTPEPGAGVNLDKPGDESSTDGITREAKGKIVGDDTASGQQDQANQAGNAQQGNPDAGAATETAARTETSETGGQDDNAGGERQPE